MIDRMVVCSAALAAVSCLFVPDATAQSELHKLFPADATAGAQFGGAVAVDGGVGVVGAYLDGENGVEAGAAYVFNTATGAELFKLYPDDGAAGDRFGAAVAIDGNLAVIGAPLASYPVGSGSGAAYVFDVTTGQQLFKLVPDDVTALGEFGASVSISGSLALVGSEFERVNGTPTVGAAYVFDVTTGLQDFRITPPEVVQNGFFGESVALDGVHAVIGASGGNHNTIRSGTAWIYNASTGLELHKLFPSDGANNDFFGQSVAIEGNLALVGSKNDGGEVYRYLVASGQEMLARLTPGDGPSGNEFAVSVSVSGGVALVGAWLDPEVASNAGAAYAYDAATAAELFKLTASDGVVDDTLGISVAISGNTLLIGADRTDDNGADSGSAYVFSLETCPLSDINNDGVVDTADLGILIGEFGDTCP